MKRIEVKLKQREHNILTRITKQGKESARTILRANILLLANKAWRTKDIAETLSICDETVSRTKKKYAKEGLNAAIYEKKRPGAPCKVDGRVEAAITLLACSDPPEGRSKWTLRLLAEKIELDISHVTVYKTLKKMNLNRG